jgi:GTP-binding protein YchF
MGFNCGILGLPNVGKSTLFNALTSTQIAESKNYPFCTIEPNIGRVKVNDERLEKISTIANSQNTIHNQLEFVDIAGLVKGASRGEGLGNKFLSNLHNVDAILHLIRCFENKDITHVENKVSPLNDIHIIETELLLSDFAKIQNIIENLKKKNKGLKIDIELISTLELAEKNLNDGVFLCECFFNKNALRILNEYNFLTLKPFIYVCNVDENSIINGNSLSKKVEDYGNKKNIKTINISAAIESEISLIEEELEKKEFLSTLGLHETSLSKLVKQGYNLLDLITFFTSGAKESRAWSCKKNSSAPDAGAKIHTDFKKGFIKAEVISFDDFIKFKGEQNCKDHGKLRFEGKDYIVRDGDIITFKFNV